jgi:hypothetical protein
LESPAQTKHFQIELFEIEVNTSYSSDVKTSAAKALSAKEPGYLDEVSQPRTLVLVQRKGKRPRKSPRGVATNNLVFSARAGQNSDLFPDILALYVAPGTVVADVTFGKGSFWKAVPTDLYQVLKSDLNPKGNDVCSADARNLPYSDESLDCVVF